MKKDNYPVYCLTVYLIFWALLAINPVNRVDWFLENILPFIFVPLLVLAYKRFRFSNTSYTLIAIFLMLHAIGSHYTYSQTPFFSELFGHRLQRDHYDRVIHFTFGFFIVYPLREFIVRKAMLEGWWSYCLPWAVIVSFSALYELMEWGVASIVAANYANAWLGIQGDEWDAHKDMLLATTGALIALLIAFFRSKLNPVKT